MKKRICFVFLIVLVLLAAAVTVACSDASEPQGCRGDHSYGEPVVIKAPTCTQAGETQRICSECGNSSRGHLDRIDHIFENGFCTMCEKYEDENMQFELNGDGESYKVSKYNEHAQTEVTVPQTYRGKPVTVIGASAFFGNQHMQRINLPSTIVEIGGGAFSGCTALEAPTLPEGLKTIANHAFFGCKFETITLPSSLTSFGTAFQQCMNLKELTFPAGVTEIPDNAFWLCNSLQSVTMLGEVTRVGVDAFSSCKQLRSFFAKGTPAIESKAFNGCAELRVLDVEKGVSKIADGAFSGCMRLYSLTLAENLTEIGNAFGGMFLTGGLTRLARVINYSSLDLVLEDKSAYGGIMRYARNGAINLTYGEPVPSEIEYINGFVFFVESGTSLDGTEIHKWYTLIDYVGEDRMPQFPDLRSDEYVLREYTIAAYAFYENDTLLLADLPEGVTRIEDNAFTECNRLLRVDIPSTVEYVSYLTNSIDGHITEIINRTKIDLSGKVNACDRLLYLNQELDPILYPKHSFDTIIKNENGFLIADWHEHIGDPLDRYVLCYVGDAGTLNIPPLPTDKTFSGYIIRSYAFANSGCVGVTLPSGVTRIEQFAFQSVNIGTLAVPDSVTYIGECAFMNAKIESLTIPETARICRIFGDSSAVVGHYYDGEGLRYVGSVLIDANIDSDDETVVKDGTVRIGDEAFAGEGKMLNLTVPEGVKYIGSYLCRGCVSLKILRLPKSIEEIGYGLIVRCNALEKIVYGGTAAEWAALIEGVNIWGNEGNKSYTVECSDGTVNMFNNVIVE